MKQQINEKYECLADSEKANFSLDPKFAGRTLIFGPGVRLGPKSPNEKKTLPSPVIRRWISCT